MRTWNDRSFLRRVGLLLGLVICTALAAPAAAQRGLDPATLTAEFYDEEDLLGFRFTRPWMQPLDFELICFGESFPFNGCKLDPGLTDGAGYSVKWQGELIVPTTGNYTFQIMADDGGRIFLDGVERVDGGWRFPSPDLQPPPRTVMLTAGRHDFRFDYEQRPPFIASLRVRWSGPDFAEEPLPLASECEEAVSVLPGSLSGSGWSMDYEISPNDGLVLSDVHLGPRLMAERISIPYFTMETSQTPLTRYELRPACAGSPGRSRLVDFTTSTSGDRLVIRAKYLVDQLPGSPGSSLEVTQDYNFLPERPEGNCEPSSNIPGHVEEVFPCNPYRLTVHYKFNAVGGETLSTIKIPERVHFKVDNSASNAGTAFKDRDDALAVILGPIAARFDLLNETYFSGIVGGQPSQWDNYHQTSSPTVQAPAGGAFDPRSILPAPGCPECAHVHWRWTGFGNLPAEFGGGKALIPRHDLTFDNFGPFTYDSNQDINFAVVRNGPGEEDPDDLLDLIDGENPNQSEMVFWYDPTGRLAEDSFWIHWGFFSTGFVDLEASATDTPDPVPGGSVVTYNVTVTNHGPGTATGVRVRVAGFQGSALPENNPGCASDHGIYTCTVPDLAVGDSRTVAIRFRPLGPAAGEATLDMRFVAVAHQVEKNVDNNEANVSTTISPRVDLELTGSVSPASVRVGDETLFSFHVSQLVFTVDAPAVVFTQRLPNDVTFLQADTTQGSCALAGRTLTCNLGDVSAVGGADVDVYVRPTRRGALVTGAEVTSDAPDANPSNNRLQLHLSVQP